MTARTVDGLALFPTAGAAHRFLALLADVAERCAWDVLAFCLMSNHIHVLVGTPRPNLGEGMHRLQGLTAQRLNRTLDRRGAVWGERYHSRLVETEEHLLQAAAYIAVNPVKAGVVDDPSAWPWSSYAESARTGGGTFANGRLLDLMADDRSSAQVRYHELVQAEAQRVLAGRAAAAA